MKNSKKKTFALEGAWYDFIGTPECSGVWFIWGNSGNGKSSFAMQLCRELAKFSPVAYNSLEEGDSLTMQRNLVRHGMGELGSRFVLIRESIEELKARLRKRKAYRIIVIDSFQYTQMSYREYIRLKDEFPDRLFIFISHAEGKHPAGKAAKSVMYDASLKVWVEGYKAVSKGRFIGPKGEFVLVVAGAEPVSAPAATVQDAAVRVRELMAGGMSRKDAIKQTAKELELPKNAVYKEFLNYENK